jgi:D-alanyl-D-alanine carboxypeptidase/D-alanyl-D-alanine-endopeptidase (penicillin-binding protein 4)
MNVTSDNLVAEGLATDVGAVATGRASHMAGVAYVAALFKDRGILAAGDRLVDASGLSATNRLSAASLVRLLAAARVEPTWGDALIRSLPRGGEGTLRGRFLEHGRADTVRAKTGHLPARAAALAGLVTSVDGSTYVFAMLMEGPDVSEARAVQDDLVRLLAEGAADADDRRQG